MLNKLLLIICGIGISLIAGCTSVTTGNKLDTSQIHNIKTGTSTKENVSSLLGTPKNKNTSQGGTSIWSYDFQETHISPLNYIPIAVYFVAGKGEGMAQNLTVTFNNSSVVTSCIYRTSLVHTKQNDSSSVDTEEMKCEDVK